MSQFIQLPGSFMNLIQKSFFFDPGTDFMKKLLIRIICINNDRRFVYNHCYPSWLFPM